MFGSRYSWDQVPARKLTLHALATIIPFLAMCDREISHRPNPASRSERLSPSEVVRTVHEHRLAGRLGALLELVVAEQRPHVLDLLHAADQLAHADRVLHAAVERQFGSAAATQFDHTAVADSFGVFSRRVEIITESIHGNRATVAIQVAGRVPLENVQLVRAGGAWRIHTDPPIPEIPKLLRDLARTMSDAARDIERKPWPADTLRAELARRQKPILARIRELTAAP